MNHVRTNECLFKNNQLSFSCMSVEASATDDDLPLPETVKKKDTKFQNCSKFKFLTTWKFLPSPCKGVWSGLFVGGFYWTFLNTQDLIFIEHSRFSCTFLYFEISKFISCLFPSQPLQVPSTLEHGKLKSCHTYIRNYFREITCNPGFSSIFLLTFYLFS